MTAVREHPGVLGEQRRLAAAGGPRDVGRLLSAPRPNRRRHVSTRRLARRRRLILLTKYALPAFALALLASVALWPELERASDKGRVAFRRLAGELAGARLTDARYRGLDEKGEPYTVTANVANQVDAERVDLTVPKADVTLTNGSWIFVRSQLGSYMQHAGQLDLWRDVELYRDDGTVLRTESATVDTKAGAAGGHEKVSAEGPFGTLDAAGFTLTDRGDAIQFHGPARLLLNARR